MSATLDDERIETPDTNGTAPSGSLAARIAARRSSLQAQSTTTLNVPGFEGILAATYRALSWQEIRGIALRLEKNTDLDTATRELYLAADTLILACEDVLEVTPDGDKVSLDVRWGVAAADRLGVALPDSANARTALLAIVPRDTWLVLHYQEFDLWQESTTTKADETVVADLERTASSH